MTAGFEDAARCGTVRPGANSPQHLSGSSADFTVSGEKTVVGGDVCTVCAQAELTRSQWHLFQ